MKRVLPILRAFLSFGLLAVVLLWLFGCGDSAPRLGSAQDGAAKASARAENTRAAADHAAVDAATAEALAAGLAAAAEREPTAARISAAADARVAAASAAAVKVALEANATAAEERAAAAADQARRERAREDKDAADAAWVSLTRWIGLGCLLAGVVLGAAIGYLTQRPRLGVVAGALVTGAGLLVLAFGVALPWLPWLAVPAIGVALWVWGADHRGSKVGLRLACELADAQADAETDEDVAANKRAAAALQDHAGVRKITQRARGKA